MGTEQKESAELDALKLTGVPKKADRHKPVSFSHFCGYPAF